MKLEGDGSLWRRPRCGSYWGVTVHDPHGTITNITPPTCEAGHEPITTVRVEGDDDG